MLSGPAQAGLATHEPTVRLAATKSIAMQCFSLSRRPHVRAAFAGQLKAARVSLKPGVRPRWLYNRTSVDKTSLVNRRTRAL